MNNEEWGTKNKEKENLWQTRPFRPAAAPYLALTSNLNSLGPWA